MHSVYLYKQNLNWCWLVYNWGARAQFVHNCIIPLRLNYKTITEFDFSYKQQQPLCITSIKSITILFDYKRGRHILTPQKRAPGQMSNFACFRPCSPSLKGHLCQFWCLYQNVQRYCENKPGNLKKNCLSFYSRFKIDMKKYIRNTLPPYSIL